MRGPMKHCVDQGGRDTWSREVYAYKVDQSGHIAGDRKGRRKGKITKMRSKEDVDVRSGR